MKYEGESSENLKYILSRNLLSTKCTTDFYKKKYNCLLQIGSSGNRGNRRVGQMKILKNIFNLVIY